MIEIRRALPSEADTLIYVLLQFPASDIHIKAPHVDYEKPSGDRMVAGEI